MQSRRGRQDVSQKPSHDDIDHDNHHADNEPVGTPSSHNDDSNISESLSIPSSQGSRSRRDGGNHGSISRYLDDAELYMSKYDVDDAILRTPIRSSTRSRRHLVSPPSQYDEDENDDDDYQNALATSTHGVSPLVMSECPAGITNPLSTDCPHAHIGDEPTTLRRRRPSTASVDSSGLNSNEIREQRRRSVSIQRAKLRNDDVDIDDDIDYNDYCPVHTHGRIDNVYRDLPRYLQDNEHIHSGYRVRLTWWQAMKSLFQLHNDLFNVWSHLLGCIAMAFLLYLIIAQQPHGLDFAYQHAIGRDYINQKLGFLTRFFLSPEQRFEQQQFFFQHLNLTNSTHIIDGTNAHLSDSIGNQQDRQYPLYIGYHETHPSFCASYYERYELYAQQFSLKQGYTPPPGAKVSANLLRTTHSIDNVYDNTVDVLPLENIPLQCRSLTKLTLNIQNTHDSTSAIVLPLELNKNLITQTRKVFETFDQELQLQLKLLKYRTKRVFNTIPIFHSIDTDLLLSSTQTTFLQTDANVVFDTKEQQYEDHVKTVFHQNKEWVLTILDDLEHIISQQSSPSNIHVYNTADVQEKITSLFIGLIRFVAPVVNALELQPHATINGNDGLSLSSSSQQQQKDPLLALTNGITHPVYFFKYFDLGEEFIDQLAVWPIVIFIFSAIVCFSCSAMFHLFSPTNFRLHRIFSRLDYAGISILIGGSNIPIIYYTFYCNDFERNLYVTCMSLGCLLTFYVTVSPAFAGTRYRAARTSLFVGLGVAGVAPFIHFTILRHFDPILLLYLVIMGATYISGAVVYVTQVPESCAPGKFDMCFASHSIWHVFVLVATFVHYLGVMYTYNSRTMSVCLDHIVNHLPPLVMAGGQ